MQEQLLDQATLSPRGRPSRQLVPWLAAAQPSVEKFLLGTAVYVLSQQWFDLLTMYIFALRALPYCKNPVTRPCAPEAVWTVQLAFACGLLATLAVLERVGTAVLECRLAAQQPRDDEAIARGAAVKVRLFQPIAGMMCGWAFGAATVALIRDLDDVCGGCIAIKIVFATLVTILSSSLIVVLQTSFDVTLLCLAAAGATLRSPGSFAAHALRELELTLASLLRLLSKALATLVMILWNYALSKAIVAGLSAQELQAVGPRLWFLWAFSLTTGLSLATVLLARARRTLAAQLAAVAAHRSADDASSGDATRDAPPTSRRPTPSVATVVHRGARAHCAALSWRGELVAVCAVLEATFGWLTGCAWTNYVASVLPTLEAYPTAGVLLSDLGGSLAATLAAVVWLVGAAAIADPARAPHRRDGDGGAAADASREREETERYFVTNSLVFFVGWCFVTCVRDLTTLIAATLGPDVRELTFVGEAVVLGAVASATTAALVHASTLSLRTYGRAAGRQGGPRIDPLHILGPAVTATSGGALAAALPRSPAARNVSADVGDGGRSAGALSTDGTEGATSGEL